VLELELELVLGPGPVVGLVGVQELELVGVEERVAVPVVPALVAEVVVLELVVQV